METSQAERLRSATMLADAWTNGLTAAITAAVLAALAPLALRSPATSGSQRVLVLPKTMRILALASAALFVGLLAWAAMSALTDSDPKLLRTLFLAGPLLLLLALAAVRETRVRLAFDDEGIGGRTAWRGHRQVRWDAIVEVRWSNAGYWLYLRDRQGEVLRVSAWLQGFPAVVEALRSHVAPERSRHALERWAARMAQLGMSRREDGDTPARRRRPER